MPGARDVDDGAAEARRLAERLVRLAAEVDAVAGVRWESAAAERFRVEARERARATARLARGCRQVASVLDDLTGRQGPGGTA
jgi:uncharacterized protein YukE